MIDTAMCLAVPARIVELEGDRAVVDAMGNRWAIRTTLLEQVGLGDIVLVHAGFAIATVDEDEARQTWELFERMERVCRQADGGDVDERPGSGVDMPDGGTQSGHGGGGQ